MQNIHFIPGQNRLSSLICDRTSQKIQPHPPVGKFLLAAAPARPSEDSLNPQEKKCGIIGFRHVVVCPAAAADNLICIRTAACQHNHRDIRSGTDVPENGLAIGIRQKDIQQNKIRPDPRRLVSRILKICGYAGRISAVFQQKTQFLPQCGIILNNQYLFHRQSPHCLFPHLIFLIISQRRKSFRSKGNKSDHIKHGHQTYPHVSQIPDKLVGSQAAYKKHNKGQHLVQGL